MPASSDPYLYPGTDVLRNLPDLRDPDQLAAFEANATAYRLAQLLSSPLPGRFDAVHLRAIHHAVLQDVFQWAGQFRTVNLSKSGHLFGLPQYIEPALAKVFADLASENYLAGLTRKSFAQRAGHFLGEINAVHLFREGNGRAQREFIRELAGHAGYRVRWSGIAPREMIEASIRSFQSGDSTRFADLIERCL